MIIFKTPSISFDDLARDLREEYPFPKPDVNKNHQGKMIRQILALKQGQCDDLKGCLDRAEICRAR